MIRSLSTLLSFLTLGALILLFPLAIGLMALSAGILILTKVYAMVTGQAYAVVCDSSGVLYTMNQIGKISLLIQASLFIAYMLIKYIIC